MVVIVGGVATTRSEGNVAVWCIADDDAMLVVWRDVKIALVHEMCLFERWKRVDREQPRKSMAGGAQRLNSPAAGGGPVE